MKKTQTVKKIAVRSVAALIVGVPLFLRANVLVSPLFTANAVLQRETTVPVWGSAAPGEKVTVTFTGQNQETVADSSGRWEVRLTPMPANARGTLTVRGKNTVELTNVVTGDVWLCAGQSNMGLKVSDATNGPTEVAAANQPDIRQFHLPENPKPETETDAGLKTVWQPANPQTAGDFSAVGYFFAREIQAALDVPVGLINCSVGGAPIQSWMAVDVLETFPGYHQVLNQLRLNPNPPVSATLLPARLYNGMIHPLIRYRIKGALWYQGEGNAGSGAHGAQEYTDLQCRLIESWRKDWNLGDFPFYFVQLPNWSYPGDASQKSWAFFREGQANCLKTPNTGMIVTLDIGDSGSLHPKNKQAVGYRLALVARAATYHQPVAASGPVMSGSTVEKNVVRVRFDYAEGGLMVLSGASPSGFEIAGPDGKFFPATAVMNHDAVLVSSPEVPSPAYVRYAWANNPSVNLCNDAGLPAAPFRTDQLLR